MAVNRIILLGLLPVLCPVAAMADDRYVAPGGTNNPPYTNWADAANSIQDAITYAVAGETVWVSNGVYQAGGVTNFPTGSILTNRVAIYKAVTVRSANNDPAGTVIKGAWDPATTNGPMSVRCVYMTNGAALVGFTLTNGATLSSNESSVLVDRFGAGVYCQSTAASMSNCVIDGNFAFFNGGGSYYGTLRNCRVLNNSGGIYGKADQRGYGGGVNYGIMYDCVVSNNIAGFVGGGVNESTLYNCLVTRNRCSDNGGGANGGSLYSCLIMGNWSGRGSAMYANTYNCTIVGNINGVYGGNHRGTISYFNSGYNWSVTPIFTNSCTYPEVGGWSAGNITNDPLFITNGAGYGQTHVPGDYHFRQNSPCMNAGTNLAWMTNAVDFGGGPRIRYGTVDMGAYEAQYEVTVYGFR